MEAFVFRWLTVRESLCYCCTCEGSFRHGFRRVLGACQQGESVEAADEDDEMARLQEEERKIDETCGVGRLRQMRTAVRNKDTAGEE
jgi:hypothetical protein